MLIVVVVSRVGSFLSGGVISPTPNPPNLADQVLGFVYMSNYRMRSGDLFSIELIKSTRQV
jgi:hypothetical protein